MSAGPVPNAERLRAALKRRKVPDDRIQEIVTLSRNPTSRKGPGRLTSDCVRAALTRYDLGHVTEKILAEARGVPQPLSKDLPFDRPRLGDLRYALVRRGLDRIKDKRLIDRIIEESRGSRRLLSTPKTRAAVRRLAETDPRFADVEQIIAESRGGPHKAIPSSAFAVCRELGIGDLAD